MSRCESGVGGRVEWVEEGGMSGREWSRWRGSKNWWNLEWKERSGGKR